MMPRSKLTFFVELLALDGGLMLVLIGRLLIGWVGRVLPAMRVPVGFGADGSSADMDLSLSS